MTVKPSLSAAGWRLGDLVVVNARNRNSHGWRGVVDGFSDESPVRVQVRFDNGRVITFHPNELVTR